MSLKLPPSSQLTRSSPTRKSIWNFADNFDKPKSDINTKIHKNHPSSDMTCLYMNRRQNFPFFRPMSQAPRETSISPCRLDDPWSLVFRKVIQIYRKRKPESRKRLGGNGLTRMSFVTIYIIVNSCYIGGWVFRSTIVQIKYLVV